jgi:hypothetical protein
VNDIFDQRVVVRGRAKQARKRRVFGNNRWGGGKRNKGKAVLAKVSSFRATRDTNFWKNDVEDLILYIFLDIIEQ